MHTDPLSSGSKRDELSTVRLGIAVRGGRARHVKHSVKRVRQAIRHVCSCSVAGQSVEFRTDSPPILEAGDRVLVAGPIRGGLLRCYVVANLEHDVRYERVQPWLLTTLGIGFLTIGWVAIVSALLDARWSTAIPAWWTVFPLAVASVLFMAFEVGGAFFLYLAREIRRAIHIVDDEALRAQVAALGASDSAHPER